MRLRLHVFLLALYASTVGLVPGVALTTAAAAPSEGQRLYYFSYVNNTQKVMSSAVDGTDERDITPTALTPGSVDGNLKGLDISGDGTSVAASMLVSSGCCPRLTESQVWVFRSDGSGAQQVPVPSDAAGRVETVRWAPDGQKLAINCEASICILSTTGEVIQRIYGPATGRSSQSITSPVWSPDGTEVAYSLFSSNVNDATKWTEIRAYNVENGVDRSIASFVSTFETIGQPVDWSANGELLIASFNGNRDLQRLAADGGSAPISIAAGAFSSNSLGYINGPAAWSPDGDEVVFAQRFGSDGTVAGNDVSLAITNANGTILRRVRPRVLGKADFAPSWVGSSAVSGDDVTGPTIAIAAPLDGAEIPQGAVVNAAYTCADEVDGSGVDTCTGDVADGQPVATVSLGVQAFVVHAADRAGNVATRSVHYTVVDVTAPTIALTSPTDGSSVGRGNVLYAHYVCSDEAGGSGVATCAGTVGDNQRLDTGTLGNHAFVVTATDNAGNPSTASVHYVVVDVTAPTINVIAPGEATHYDQGATIAASYSCADEAGGSGLANCDGTVANGQPIDTSVSGAHLFTIIAADDAGNQASQTIHYTADDKIAPHITITSPIGSYTSVQVLSNPPKAQFSCMDNPGGSGMASCTAKVDGHSTANGASVPRSTGTHTVVVTATDKAGNTMTQTSQYHVYLVCVLGICI